jgi:hypothetical protein
MRRLLLLDLDGVVADCRHRLHWQKCGDYDAFYSADEILKDEVIVQGKDLKDALATMPYYTSVCSKVALTGRPERTRLSTNCWLDHNSIYFDEMIMRKDGDYRPSGIIKVENLIEWQLKRKEDKLTKRQLNKLKKNPDASIFDEWDEIIIVDDDPGNIKALHELIPRAICLTFGTERMGEL